MRARRQPAVAASDFGDAQTTGLAWSSSATAWVSAADSNRFSWGRAADYRHRLSRELIRGWRAQPYTGAVRKAVLGVGIVMAGWRAYRLHAAGAITVDLGIGRRVQPLGPLAWRIAAPREIVFDVIAAPYLERTPRALEDKLQVWERSADMVLAAHFTPVKCGVTTTVETVRFQRPERIDFRLVRGPVPHVVESFLLAAVEDSTDLTWEGELGTDLWSLGAWWGGRVSHAWENAVRGSLASIAAEAERVAGHAHGSAAT